MKDRISNIVDEFFGGNGLSKNHIAAVLFVFGIIWIVLGFIISRWLSFPPSFGLVIALFSAVSILGWIFIRTVTRLSHTIRKSLLTNTRNSTYKFSEKERSLKFNHMLESLNDVYWSFDMTGGGGNYVSASGERIYRQSLADLESKPFFWIEKVHPEDTHIQNSLRDRLMTNGYAEGTYRIINDEQRIFHIYSRGKLIRNNNGQIVRIEGISTDVSYVKHAESIIEEQEFQMRAVFENLDISVTIIDCAGRIVLFNKFAAEMCRNIGRPISKGDSIYELAPAERKSSVLAVMRKVLATKKTVSHVVDYDDVQGVAQYFSIQFTPVFDALGGVSQICIMSKNVTEQKTADEKLRTERNLLRTLIDNLPDYVYVKDLELRHVINNKANVHLIGAATELETLGKKTTDYFPGDVSALFEDDDRKIIQTQSSRINVEEQLIAADGTRHWLLTTKVPLKNDEGKIIGLVGISRDITERKEMESSLRVSNERFRMARRATDDAIWDWDLTTDDLYLDENFTALFGYELTDEKVNLESWARHIHPQDAARIVKSVQDVLESPAEKWWKGDYRYLCADGSIAYVSDRGFIICDDSGKAIRMIGAMQNVTEITEYRKSLEEKVKARTLELNRALAKEKELVDMKSRFVSIASHEFRTPLSAVQFAAGFVKSFHNRMKPEEIIHKMTGIENQVKHMTCFLNDILSIDHVDSGKLKVAKADVSLNDFFHRTIEDIQSTTGYSHVVRRNFLGECVIRADERFLKNIFGNLIQNAIKFSPSSKGIVINLQEQSGYACVEIVDDGVGIPADEIEKIFDSFHRAENVKNIDGTGLGLAIVKKAVDLLDGQITVVSELGKGSSFTVKLPLS